MKLEPTSETEFFHISYFDFFEITFLPEENGEINRFVLRNAEGDHKFERIFVEANTDAEESIPETFWSIVWSKISDFSGTNTFKFLAIIMGLVLLQIVLQYLRSLLV